MIMGQHRDQCRKLPLSCPNDCGLTDIIRSEMEEHLKKCPLQKTICKYHNIGCKAMLTSEDQDEHDEACMKEHFQLMSKELVVAKEELMDAKLRMNRTKQITEQVRNELALTKEELMDVTLKAGNLNKAYRKRQMNCGMLRRNWSSLRQKPAELNRTLKICKKNLKLEC